MYVVRRRASKEQRGGERAIQQSAARANAKPQTKINIHSKTTNIMSRPQKEPGRDERVGDRRSTCGPGPWPLELAAPVRVEGGRSVLGPSQRWGRSDAVGCRNWRRGEVAAASTPRISSVAGCSAVAECARSIGHGRRRVRRVRTCTILHGRGRVRPCCSAAVETWRCGESGRRAGGCKAVRRVVHEPVGTGQRPRWALPRRLRGSNTKGILGEAQPDATFHAGGERKPIQVVERPSRT